MFDAKMKLVILAQVLLCSITIAIDAESNNNNTSFNSTSIDITSVNTGSIITNSSEITGNVI